MIEVVFREYRDHSQLILAFFRTILISIFEFDKINNYPSVFPHINIHRKPLFTSTVPGLYLKQACISNRSFFLSLSI